MQIGEHPKVLAKKHLAAFLGEIEKPSPAAVRKIKLQKGQKTRTKRSETKTRHDTWVFPKIMGKPKSSILIGFYLIFTIHFGG